MFGTNPAGLEYDGQVTNEGQGSGRFGGGGGGRPGSQQAGSGAGFNLNWDGVWQVRTRISDIGWTAEFAIPFRTLRYLAGEVQTWGINFQRNIRSRNETASWSPIQRQSNLNRLSLAGELQGVEVPPQRNLKLTPYVLGEAVRRASDDRTTTLGDAGARSPGLRRRFPPSAALYSRVRCGGRAQPSASRSRHADEGWSSVQEGGQLVRNYDLVSMPPCRSCARTRSVPVVAGLLLMMSACATNPVTGNLEFVLMSESQEISLGRQTDVDIQRDMGVYDDPAIQRYVQEVGLSLAALSHRPDLPWQFTVVDSPAVNAFALPGGVIYLTRGIMAYLGDEAELSGVLGHEIGHVTARHGVQSYTRASSAQLGVVLGQVFVPQMRTNPYGLPGLSDAAGTGLGLLFLKFGRDDEIQADRLGAEYGAAGGWDPRGVSDMLSTLGRISEAADRQGTPNFLSTHPEPEARVVEVGPVIQELMASRDPGSFRVDRAGYLDRIEGLRFGDNPEDGVVRGSEFLHPPLRFALAFPAGWEVRNSETVVMAKEPGAETYVLLQLAENPQGNDLARIAEQAMRDSGYRRSSGGETRINGLDAYLGTYIGRADGIGDVTARVAYIRYGQDVYVLGGRGPSDSFSRVEGDVNRSIRSFRPLSRVEAESILPNEIATYLAKPGDTWQSIAQVRGEEIVSARTLAIMNGFPVNEQLRPGDRLKIVVSGGGR